MTRTDGRANDEIRPIKITRHYVKYAEGSCLIEVGDTRVICTATVEEKTPVFLKGTGSGWITAEYGMIPRSCQTRAPRDAGKLSVSGRTQEIQRLVGRSLRSIVDLHALGERTIWLDCDVIQADGGTRTASVNGAFVALVDALNGLKKQGIVKKLPINDLIGAVSVGVVENEECLDLSYQEDSHAAVDMNVIMTASGRYVEIQGTAETMPFSRNRLNKLLDFAQKGVNDIVAQLREALADVL